MHCLYVVPHAKMGIHAPGAYQTDPTVFIDDNSCYEPLGTMEIGD